MKDVLNIIAWSVMVPIWILIWTIEGIALLFFGTNVFPNSSTWHPMNEFLASVVGQRLADSIAGVLLLIGAYFLFTLARNALGTATRRRERD